jgi:gliding motility-associated-like protein
MKKILPSIFALFSLLFVTETFAQGGDNCASAQASPITLPFTGTVNTCAATDDYSSIPTSCVPSYYTASPDWLYYFCATSNGQVTINLSNMNPAYAYSSITVYSGCPTGPNCIAGGTQSVSGGQGLTFTVTTSSCYFIMIDNWPPPACFSANITIAYVVPPPVQPSCTNMDFETGSFTGWYGTSGSVVCGVPNGPSTVYNSSIVGMPSAQHTIMTGAGTDACGGFPVVFPGGNFSVKLGDGQVAGNGGGHMEQTFQVSQTNSNFTYNYAVVLEDASHLSNEQPFFQVEMFDCNMNPIACGNYLVVGGPNIPNFSNNGPCGTWVYYRPWTAVNIDLSAFIGSCVTIKFTVGDCCYGGHYGYAYIDCSCMPMQISGNDSICVGQSTTLSAPSGSANYLWSPGNQTTQNITVSPTVTTVYTVTLTSITNPNCLTVLSDTVWVVPSPDAIFTVQTTASCAGGGVATFTNNSTGATTYTWIFGDASPNSNAQFPPPHTYGPGNYTVTLIVTNASCTDTLLYPITFPPPDVIANFSSVSVCLNNATTFTDLSTGATQWSWNFGEPSSGPLNLSNLQSPSHTYSNAGTYTVTLITIGSNPQCADTMQIQVIVHPLPTATFNAASVCVGSTTQFTDQSTISGGNIQTWNWNFGDPNSGPNNISTLQNPSHLFSSSGTFTVILTVTSDQGCQNSTTFQLVVNPLPVALLTADDTAGCVTHCMNFTDLSTVPTPGVITGWFWDFGDGNTSTVQNPSHCYTVVGSYTVTLTVTTNAGCTATYVNPNYIDVYPIPTAEFTADPNPTTVLNTTIQFTDLSSGSPVSWLWDFGDFSPTDNIQHPIHTYPNENTGVFTYMVTLTIVNQYGCTSTVQHPIVINPEFTFYAPNCVTPNGDGVNDFFHTYGVGWREYKLMIFDRWGDLIWWTEDMDKGWDAKVIKGLSGDVVQEDVYVWKVVLRDVFDKKHNYIGHVSVIR